uniref:KIB1-4 beta-propeller domain-containing protein n=1 Tax=Oryza glumipatula TaxID=40148 RepID=A0A0E0B2I6_9ORYZ
MNRCTSLPNEDDHQFVLVRLKHVDIVAVIMFKSKAHGLVKNLKSFLMLAWVIHGQPPLFAQKIYIKPPFLPIAIVVLVDIGNAERENRVDPKHSMRVVAVDDEVEHVFMHVRNLTDDAGYKIGIEYRARHAEREVSPGGGAADPGATGDAAKSGAAAFVVPDLEALVVVGAVVAEVRGADAGGAEQERGDPRRIGIKENKQSILLDPKLAPMLWFHYNYYMPLEESDNEDNEESGDDDDVSDEDEFSETSDEDESTEETDDDGISEDNEIDVNGDDDDNTTDEGKEVNDTLLLYNISSKQLVAHDKLYDLKDHFYWITPQGWLLMLHRDSHEIFLWNPSTFQRISLPFDQDRFLRKNYTRCLLSHSPTDPNCIVLVLSLHNTIIWYCHIGGTQWSMHEYHARRFHRHRLTVIKSMSLFTAVGEKFYTTFGDRIVTL